MKEMNTTRAAMYFKRALESIRPGVLGDDALQNEIRRTYCAAEGLQHSHDGHPLATLRPILKAHLDRLWIEYKKRFGQGEKWPAYRDPDGAILTPAGFRAAYCNPERIRKESMRELRLSYHAWRGDRGIRHIDPVVTLQSAELVLSGATKEYVSLLKAEIARRPKKVA